MLKQGACGGCGNSRPVQAFALAERISGSAPNKPLKDGFTLAEVLITLSIIGVVAALTIPTLIQRTGDEEMVSKLFKVYSTLSQATESIITEQGSPKVWNTNVDALYNAYKAKLRVSKDCGTKTGCFSQFGTSSSGGYIQLNGVQTTNNNWNISTAGRRVILSDGVQMTMGYLSQACSMGYNNSYNVCADFGVDINGVKGPNTFGRDIFLFVLKESGLYPAGCDGDIEASCVTGKNGAACTCKVISEGAINY